MLKSILLVGVLLAVPALADPTCGAAPLAPAVPGARDLSGKTPDDAHKMVLDVLANVRAYQTSLATYRTCLTAQENATRSALVDAQSKGDKDKINAAKDQLASLVNIENQAYDTEKQVADDFNALHVAYCKMGTNLVGCPQTAAH